MLPQNGSLMANLMVFSLQSLAMMPKQRENA